MTSDVVGNYIRVHRRRCGLTQRELGILIGCPRGNVVGNHELSRKMPSLLVALAYETVFEVPVGEIFTGFRSAVADSVIRNLTELKVDLEKQRAAGKRPNPDKIQWLSNQRIG